MAGAKLVVLYPYPQDVDTFERAYTEDHVPMVNPETIKGITRFVATKTIGTPDGSTPPFYRMAELHFPSLDALKECASSESAQKVVAHAVSISSGGQPIVLIAEEETSNF
ncbi:MAG: EthD family reductase [bacterium]